MPFTLDSLPSVQNFETPNFLFDLIFENFCYLSGTIFVSGPEMHQASYNVVKQGKLPNILQMPGGVSYIFFIRFFRRDCIHKQACSQNNLWQDCVNIFVTRFYFILFYLRKHKTWYNNFILYCKYFCTIFFFKFNLFSCALVHT